jgi:hypothetical protein
VLLSLLPQIPIFTRCESGPQDVWKSGIVQWVRKMDHNNVSSVPQHRAADGTENKYTFLGGGGGPQHCAHSCYVIWRCSKAGQLLGSMIFLRRLVNLVDLLIPNFCVFNNHTPFSALFISVSAKHHTPSLQDVLLTLQEDISNTFTVAISRTTKRFYFLWLTNLNFSEIRLDFRGRKKPTT